MSWIATYMNHYMVDPERMHRFKNFEDGPRWMDDAFRFDTKEQAETTLRKAIGDEYNANLAAFAEVGQKYTHDELVGLAYRFLPTFYDIAAGRTPNSHPPVIVPEPGMVNMLEHPDLFAIDGKCNAPDYWSCVIECKATRSDYLADRKKAFRVYPEKGMGLYRAMILNPGIWKDDGPVGWAIFEAVDKAHIRCLHWPAFGMGQSKSFPNSFNNRNIAGEFYLWRNYMYWQEKGYPPKRPKIDYGDGWMEVFWDRRNN